MAGLTYTNIETRVMNQLRIPTTNTTEQTKIAALINEVYRDIYAKADWWWLIDRQVINTANDYTTGTVSVTAASTSASFSDAPTDLGSFAGRVLSVPGEATDSGAIWRIATHTADATAFTLDATYTGATAATASFSVYQDAYDLATDVGKVLHIQRFGYQWPLEPVGMTEMLNLKQYDVSEGKPQIYTVLNFDTSGDPTTQRQLIVHPYPDDTYRLVVHYKQALNTELSSTTQPLIPDDYRQILVYGALARGYPIFLNDLQRGQFFQSLFNDMLNLMSAIQREKTDDRPMVQPRDDYRRFYGRARRITPGRVDLGPYFDRLPNIP